MKEDWWPDKTAIDWIQSFGLTIEQATPVIFEFKQYWLQRSQRRKNWSLALMRNGIAENSLIRMRNADHGNKQRKGPAETHFDTMQKLAASGKA